MEIDMKFLERDLEDILYNYTAACNQSGFITPPYDFVGAGKMFRQVNLGGYGVADLVEVVIVRDDAGRRHLFINIIECKQNQIDIFAYMQVKRYKAAFLELLADINLSNTSVHVHTVLVGKSIEEDSDFVFLLNDDRFCTVFRYAYSHDGIKFTLEPNIWFRPEGYGSKLRENAAAAIRELLEARSKDTL